MLLWRGFREYLLRPMEKVPSSPVATVRCRYADLARLFRRRQEEEGYRSLSDYFLWLAFYDVLLRRPHHVSAHVAHLSTDRQEAAVEEVVENFDKPQKPGALFESRLRAAAQEETWRLHGEIRALKERVRELENELVRERAQGKLGEP